MKKPRNSHNRISNETSYNHTVSCLVIALLFASVLTRPGGVQHSRDQCQFSWTACRLAVRAVCVKVGCDGGNLCTGGVFAVLGSLRSETGFACGCFAL